jgi:hypothetical protein
LSQEGRKVGQKDCLAGKLGGGDASALSIKKRKSKDEDEDVASDDDMNGLLVLVKDRNLPESNDTDEVPDDYDINKVAKK